MRVLPIPFSIPSIDKTLTTTRLNILFVADVSAAAVIGGAERVLFEQGTRLAQRGHCVHLITRRLPGHQGDREHIQGVEEIRCAFAPQGGLRSVVQSWQQARRQLVRLHEHLPIDILNVHQPLTAFGLISPAAVLGIPRVYTCHSLSAEEYISRNTATGPANRLLRCLNAAARKRAERRVLRSCDRVIALSYYTRDKLWRAHGIAADRVDIVPGGVDLDRFCPAADKAALRNELGIPQDRFVVFTVRNLVPRMGVDRLVQAMQTVSSQIPQALLVIGGHGPLRDELLTIGNHLNLQDHVRMAGFVPEEALARYYQMADLFVLPSLDLEGFGMVTLEAMACGLPVIGTPVGGTKEILSGFNRRYLLRGSGVEDIAQGIISYYELISASRTRAFEISRECRRHVEARYSWNQNIATLERLFNQAKHGRSPRPVVAHAGVSGN